MKNSRPVYSTETGRICPECGRAASQCSCKRKKTVEADSRPAGYPKDGMVRIRRETKGRRGKTVTSIYGLPLEERELQDLARRLKRCCGAGGSIVDGVIEIQGDHRQALLEEIRKQGYPAKLAGG
ncbi:MAG: translation initiation factor Sui1 [Desulfobacteraceae bacterium]|nr:MAG: translation initiation factor Sui1 [Desulfobacteraceae bacterium]